MCSISGLTKHNLCRNWALMDGSEREKSKHFLLPLSAWEQQVSSVYVNERNTSGTGCKECIKAQSEQQKPDLVLDVISVHAAAHLSTCTPSFDKSLFCKQRQHLIKSCWQGGVGNYSLGSITFWEVWKISIKVKGRGGTSARTVLL